MAEKLDIFLLLKEISSISQGGVYAMTEHCQWKE